MFNFYPERQLIMDRKDALTIVDLVNKNTPVTADYRLEKCGWSDPNKYYLSFFCSKRRFARIIRGINKIGKINVESEPNSKVVQMIIEIDP